MICAITNNDVLGVKFLTQGGTTASDFGIFLLSLISNYPSIFTNNQDYILVFDNTSIHTSTGIKTLLDRLNVQFLPPYSPFLNPIEEFFGLLKQNLKQKNGMNSNELVLNVLLALKKITCEYITAFFNHSLEFYDRCLNRMIIE